MIDLRLGDCLELMRGLPDQSIDAVITSPQYNLGGDFHSSSVNDGLRRSFGGYGDNEDNLPEQQYQDLQVMVLNELHRITRKDGWAFYVHKNRIKGGRIISPLYWLEKTNWKVYQDVVVDMNGTTNVDKRRFFPSHEFVFVLAASGGTILHNDSCYTSVWRFPQVNRKDTGHPAAFPIGIPERCILSCSREGDTILDPFMGSGTTGAACVKLGRNFIGMEINPDYFKIAQKRIADAQLQMTMPMFAEVAA